MHDQAAVDEPGPEETLDAVLRGRLRLIQPRRGARVSLDALLLADFAARTARRPRLGRVLDLGCGGGVVALALAARDPAAVLTGVELQPALAALARRNAALNGAAERFDVVEGDLRRARELPLRPASFDLCVANPPFQRQGAGRVAPGAQRALSRAEVSCTVDDVVAAARRFLRDRGRFAVVFPAERLADLMAGLARSGFGPRIVRQVQSVADEPARRVLVEAARGYRGGAKLEPPLVIHQQGDRRSWTEETARILGDR